MYISTAVRLGKALPMAESSFPHILSASAYMGVVCVCVKWCEEKWRSVCHCMGTNVRDNLEPCVYYTHSAEALHM